MRRNDSFINSGTRDTDPVDIAHLRPLQVQELRFIRGLAAEAWRTGVVVSPRRDGGKEASTGKRAHGAALFVCQA